MLLCNRFNDLFLHLEVLLGIQTGSWNKVRQFAQLVSHKGDQRSDDYHQSWQKLSHILVD